MELQIVFDEKSFKELIATITEEIKALIATCCNFKGDGELVVDLDDVSFRRMLWNVSKFVTVPSPGTDKVTLAVQLRGPNERDTILRKFVQSLFRKGWTSYGDREKSGG